MAAESTLDPQVVDAVERTNLVVDETARQAATTIACQEIAQSMALAVQSGVDHLQSAFTLNVATTGSTFARALDNSADMAEYRAVLEASQATVSAAIDNLATLAANAAAAMRGLAQKRGDEPGEAS